ncbi:MAG: hypothetical protein ABH843_08010 [Candidatus Omnitrophota bacterium]
MKKYRARTKAILQTWAKKTPCTYYVTDTDSGDSYNTINLGPKTYEQLPEKSYYMYKYINEKFINEKKWIVKIDDDTYLRLDRLAKVLSGYDYKKAWYLGDYKTLSKAFKVDMRWLSGSTVVLSQKCVKELMAFLETDKGKDLYFSMGAGEDISLGECLSQLDILPTHMPGIFCKPIERTFRDMENLVSVSTLPPLSLLMLHSAYMIDRKLVYKAFTFLDRKYRRIWHYLEVRSPFLEALYLASTAFIINPILYACLCIMENFRRKESQG